MEMEEYQTAMVRERTAEYTPTSEIPHLMSFIRREMRKAAENLEFEKAAGLRDRIRELTKDWKHQNFNRNSDD
jgi:excinuclease ABC subunit B